MGVFKKAVYVVVVAMMCAVHYNIIMWCITIVYSTRRGMREQIVLCFHVFYTAAVSGIKN